MASLRSYDVLLAPSFVGKTSSQYKELQRIARRANRGAGEPPQNFAIVWLAGGRPAFRFFNEKAAQQFRSNATAGSLS